MSSPILVVEELSKSYSGRRGQGTVRGLNGVSFEVAAGEAIGIVGESGSGKSTLGRCILGLVKPSRGRVLLDGAEITRLSERNLRPLRVNMQIVYQEPNESFDPRMSMCEQITEPLRALTGMSREERKHECMRLLTTVGLSTSVAGLRPRMLSGGMLQRCAIARAISTSPKLIVLDEPTSVLPHATAMEIVQLFKELQRSLNLTLVVITHDVELLHVLCDRVIVVYLGQVVEVASKESFFSAPLHPYSRALLGASLVSSDFLISADLRGVGSLVGEPQSSVALPSGCFLESRCPFRQPKGCDDPQSLDPVYAERLVRCWRVTTSARLTHQRGSESGEPDGDYASLLATRRGADAWPATSVEH